MPTTVLAFSGGLASTALLWGLRRRGDRVRCVFVDYGQPSAAQELKAAGDLVDEASRDCRAGCEIDLSVVTLSGFPSSLLPTHGPQAGRFSQYGLTVLSVVAAHGVALGAQQLACGVTMERTLPFEYHFASLMSLASQDRIALEVPFREFYSGAVLRYAAGLHAPLKTARSCLLSGPRHCGSCWGCKARRQTFQMAALTDPTDYANSDGALPAKRAAAHEFGFPVILPFARNYRDFDA